MLHYYGSKLAMELGEAARGPYLRLYSLGKKDVCYVPFMDLEKGTKRYVKFEWLDAVGWVYVDLVNSNA